MAATPQAPTAPSPWKRPEFRRLFAISTTVALGFGMVVPVLPLFAKSFGVGLGAIGLIQLVFGTMRFSFGLVGGLVVDRFGERASTITGLLVVAASSYAAGFADSFLQLVLARGFGGAGSALFIGGLMNRLLRIIEPEAMGRATGAFRSSFLIGIAAGPVFGGVVAKHYGLAAPFVIYGTVLLVAAVIAWFILGAPAPAGDRPRRSPTEALRAARPLLVDPRYVLALAATFVGWWTIAGPAQTVGVVFAEDVLGFSTDQIGLAVTFLALGELPALFVSGWAADRFGRRAVLVPSLLLTAGATAMLGQIEGARFLFFPLMVLIGMGIASGGAAAGGLMADAIPREGSGAAVGVNQMAGDLGFLISPIAVGTLAENTSFGTAYIVAAIPAALVLVLAFRVGAARGASGASIPAEPEPAEPVG